MEPVRVHASVNNVFASLCYSDYPLFVASPGKTSPIN